MTCPDCDGSGVMRSELPEDPTMTCPTCNGSGQDPEGIDHEQAASASLPERDEDRIP